MAYCDYEFYKSEYFGNVIQESDFPRLAERASEKIDSFTFGEMKKVNEDIIWTRGCPLTLDEYTAKKVKKATCRIAEIIGDIETYEKASRDAIGYEKTEEGQRGKVVSSVSSGSESIHYETSANTSNSLVGAVLTDKKAQNQLYYDTVKEYLSGTGLLYAGF